MKVKKKEGRMEYWSIGVMEYWKDQKTGDRMKSTGIMEGWGKEIPPGLPLAKGGDSRKGWKNSKGEPLGPGLTAEGLMSFHSRKEGGIGKAGEDWHT